jgi:crotonobetainyl-CoA:carnitine CoA-transferase CaiB-like acyl-CoA transferase
VSSPLTGLKVVELVRILAAPWIGQTLSVLSTVVIKIKSPEGDDTREWGGGRHLWIMKVIDPLRISIVLTVENQPN